MMNLKNCIHTPININISYRLEKHLQNYMEQIIPYTKNIKLVLLISSLSFLNEMYLLKSTFKYLNTQFSVC